MRAWVGLAIACGFGCSISKGPGDAPAIAGEVEVFDAGTGAGSGALLGFGRWDPILPVDAGASSDGATGWVSWTLGGGGAGSSGAPAAGREAHHVAGAGATGSAGEVATPPTSPAAGSGSEPIPDPPMAGQSGGSAGAQGWGPETVLWEFSYGQGDVASAYANPSLAVHFKHFLNFYSAEYSCRIGDTGDWIASEFAGVREFPLDPGDGACFTTSNEFSSIQTVTSIHREDGEQLGTTGTSTARPDRFALHGQLTSLRFIVRNTLTTFAPMTWGVVSKWELIGVPR